MKLDNSVQCSYAKQDDVPEYWGGAEQPYSYP